MKELTLDAGALIAIERRKSRGASLMLAAREREATLLVPMPVVTEWWRGSTEIRERILRSVNLEPLTAAVARVAGEALARLNAGKSGPSVVDAIVMASAAARGGIVYTSDVDDLGALRDAYFPSVRILAI
jgi:predicted nucleic acid-binding protein